VFKWLPRYPILLCFQSLRDLVIKEPTNTVPLKAPQKLIPKIVHDVVKSLLKNFLFDIQDYEYVVVCKILKKHTLLGYFAECISLLSYNGDQNPLAFLS
jgi:hypothetical protein